MHCQPVSPPRVVKTVKLNWFTNKGGGCGGWWAPRVPPHEMVQPPPPPPLSLVRMPAPGPMPLDKDIDAASRSEYSPSPVFSSRPMSTSISYPLSLCANEGTGLPTGIRARNRGTRRGVRKGGDGQRHHKHLRGRRNAQSLLRCRRQSGRMTSTRARGLACDASKSGGRAGRLLQWWGTCTRERRRGG